MKGYPKGAPINQHKSLATGQGLRKCDTRDLDKNGWGQGQPATVGRTNISSGDTGRAGKVTPPTTSPVTPP